MFVIIGIVVVFVSVLGGFAIHGGPLAVQPVSIGKVWCVGLFNINGGAARYWFFLPVIELRAPIDGSR